MTYALKPAGDDEYIGHWRMTHIEHDTVDGHQQIQYLTFEFNDGNGTYKTLKYSSYSHMLFGIEECDADVTDLSVIIEFIQTLAWRTNSDFRNHFDEYVLLTYLG